MNNLDRLNAIKDRFKDKNKAVIVGNGPSINDIDWDSLDASSTVFLGCNRLSNFFIENNVTWRPDIYTCFTSSSLKDKEWRDSIDRCLMDENIVSFVFKKYRSFSKLSNFHNDVFFCENVKEHYRHGPVSRGFMNEHPSKNIIKSFSATVVLFQICNFLNVEEIAVIGQDGYIFERGMNHFSDSYKNEPTNFQATNERILKVHRELRRHFLSKSVKIYNCSKKSVLKDVHEFRSLDSFVKT